jgi:ribosomal protein uL23
MDQTAVIKHPLSTEKSIRLLEAENKLVFVVDIKATKKEIKDAFESMFKVKALKVNVSISPQGEKRAYVKLPADSPAIDIATDLGLM